VIATNAGMIGVSRLTFSMGQHRQLPERLRQVHPRYRTPHVAIITFSIIASIALIPGQADLLATMYSFGAMLSFTVAHLAILWMRRRRPGVARGWKPPGEVRVAGVEVPLTAVLGGLGTFAAWIVVMVMNPVTMAIGLGWMALGAAVYLLYRRSQDLPVKKTVKVLLPEPLDVEEVELKSVLVPFEDDPFSELTIGTAARLAARKGRAIHVISLLNVPAHLPIDAPLPRQEEKAQSKIEQAKLIGGRRVSGHVQRIRPGQAAKAIVEEAKDIQAVAIVMQLIYRNGAPLYGKTLQGVLGDRPCRVIVAADPTEDVSAKRQPVMV
jgi:APA family basic amino acid/polyamine antiporter